MVTIRSKTGKQRTIPLPSAQYVDYESAASFFLQHDFPPIENPVNVRCRYYMPTRRAVDLTNLLEATDDILVRYDVLKDDNCRIVAGHDGSRVLYDKDNPRTEIYIEEYNDETF